jgi:DNA-binding response OmpR family regulator
MNPDRPQVPFPSILIVDDEPVTRMMVRQVLEEAGYIVLEAEDGNIGVELCAQSRPDLVLMDVSMPNLNGFEACRTIHSKDATRHTPILMLTSLDDVQSVRLAFEAGATDFITKPINWALLSQRIRYALKARDIEWQLRESEGRLSDAHRIARLEHWSVDVNEGQVTVSPGLGRILNLDSQLGHGLRAVMRRFSRAERSSLLQFVRAAMRDEAEREAEVRLHAEDSGTH